MTKNTTAWRRAMLATTALCASAIASQALAQAANGAAAPKEVEEIVVVGSQIQGAKTNAALPVTVVGQAQIQAIGAVSGDDLFRSIPQMGDVSFNSSYLPNSSNSARGDVGSVNLRNLGVGNTLVLLNGRRVVAHPTSRADDNLVPVLTYNTNAIPVSGVKRMEVLRDGAAALYGSDAVAGVVNTVLQDDYQGLTVEAQYGGAEGTHMHEGEYNFLAGRSFQDGRGNITLFGNYDTRSALRAQDQDFTAYADKRPLFVGTEFEGAATLDGRSTITPWASLQTPASFGTVKQGTTSLTSSSGAFHIGPSALPGCRTDLGGGYCLATGAPATSGTDRDLRYDTNTFNTSVIPELKRLNLFATGHYDLTDDITAFGEVGYYHAVTHSLQAPTGTLSSLPITVPASNYYNPFGPVTFANGQANPNRLPGLNIPASGLPVTIRSYEFVDVGPNEVDDTNDQTRFLVGLRGQKWGWHWESALVYSQARVKDVSDGVSATLLQKQLALSTPDAYNLFNGGGLANYSGADTTPSSQAAIDAVSVKVQRISTSSLAMWDFKVSRPDLFTLPGGDLGIALGLEARRETQKDDRDPRVDGTINFTDSVTGQAFTGDLIGTSPSPDTKGKREVESAYAELQIPLISPDMNIPLVYKVDVQLAGRFENFSDVGSVAKPKIAAAWDLFDGFRLRGSYSEGFKAPNLEQVNATLVTRSNTRTDYIRCEQDLRAGRITSFANCSRSGSTTAQRSGNPDLKPEESTNETFGVVYEPHFLPEEFGHFMFTVDYWRIQQKGIVGLFGEGNALILDYLDRMKGTTNPNVIRAAPSSDDIAAAAGTGLAPVGQVLYVKDQYVNLLPQEVSGLDFGLNWRLATDRFGDFNLDVNVAHLLKFYQQPNPQIAELLAARAAGTINAGTTITGGGDLIGQNGKPAWKWSAALTWNYGPVTVGAFTQYTGSVEDTSLLDSVGDAWVVDSTLTANLYGEYEFKDAGWASDTRLRIGVRNITDEKPPLASSGYLGNLYEPYGRYWYASIRKSF
jgi:outer membrane receptor protein involved in Fe transport